MSAARITFASDGEEHLLNPQTISKLQHAVQQSNPKTFKEYTDLIDDQKSQHVHAAQPDENQGVEDSGAD